MKRVAVLLLVVGLMMFAVIPAASAHVHGITPLGCEEFPANSHAGATQSPHSGLIPLSVGNAQGIALFGGGFQAAGPHCP